MSGLADASDIAIIKHQVTDRPGTLLHQLAWAERARFVRTTAFTFGNAAK